MDWLHRFLVPSEHNGYRPDSLEARAAGIMLALIMMSFALANVQSLLLVTSDWFTASILPAALVDLTNDERDSEGLTTLTRSARLDAAAQLKADNMAAEGYFSHDSPTGVTPWHWFNEVGYEYAYAGENLAVHFSDSEDVVTAWMNSPGHRANIMNGRYSEIGIGTAKGTYKGSPTVFVVQLFGTPAVPDELTAPTLARSDEAEPVPATEQVVVQEESDATVLGVNDLESHVRGTLVTIETPIEALFEQVNAATPDETTLIAQAVPQDESTLIAQAVPQSDVRAVKHIAEMSTSSARASAVPPAVSRHPSEHSFGAHLGDLLYRLLASPHTILAGIYLTLTFAVVVMLTFAIVVEWRRQHPIQVAYGVGLMATMFLLMTLHLSLTSGATIV
jgi:hypothetical protein